MSKAIFLFDGGNYKRGDDSGRCRTPLTDADAEMVFYDPEIPGDTDNAIGSELNMTKYASKFCDLEVGDEIFMGLAPDAALYRGLFMMSFDKVTGFQVQLDLVSVKDVYAAHQAGDATGVAPFNSAPLAYDFSNGLGDATKDACQQAKMYGGEPSDYRDNSAMAARIMSPQKFAMLSQALYFRLTVVALGELGGADESACCNTCGGDNYPTFQVGAVYDRLCIDKQRVRNFCNCPEQLCDEGCEASKLTK